MLGQAARHAAEGTDEMVKAFDPRAVAPGGHVRRRAPASLSEAVE
jgi:hypothetical protein